MPPASSDPPDRLDPSGRNCPGRRALLATGLLLPLGGCGEEGPAVFDGRQLAAAGETRITPPEDGRRVGDLPALTDHRGRPFGEAEVAGRWRLIGFGYGSCPDQCPNLLGTMAETLDLLGPDATALAALFVSFDPDRDTPARLALLITQFHPDLVALTGEDAVLASLIARFDARFWRVPPADPLFYRMDHTSLLYLVDPAGRARRSFWPHHAPETIADALRMLRSQA